MTRKEGKKGLFRRIKEMETRVDIEEAINLADQMPEKVEFMRKELLEDLRI